MDKIIYTGDQDALLEQCSGMLWTLIEDGSHVKRAASDAISEKMIRDHLPDSKHFAIHYIAMGAGEQFGPNKNGDVFPERALKKYHHTFVKNGHYFREHANRDPLKKIGDIKASAYNDKMHRVELIIHGDKKLAEPEYEAAKAGKDLDGSMSCRVPLDRCSICDNKAKSSKNYCVDLRRYMTQYRPQFKKFAYAINDDPTFFDFSSVANRADRIARHLEVNFHPDDDLEKAASESAFRFSDELATDAGILLPRPAHVGCHNPENQAWLVKLAAAETYINAALYDADNVAKDSKFSFFKQAQEYAFAENSTTEDQMAELRKLEPGVLFRLMAKHAAVLPFLEFFTYVNNQSIKAASEDTVYLYSRSKLLPTMFNDAMQSVIDSGMESEFEPASRIKEASAFYEVKCSQAVADIGYNNSLEIARVHNRILHNCAVGERSTPIKSASTMSLTDAQLGKGKKLALAYALYKVAACKSIEEFRGSDFIDEPSLLLIASQHR